jgi:hypothetical protein
MDTLLLSSKHEVPTLLLQLLATPPFPFTDHRFPNDKHPTRKDDAGAGGRSVVLQWPKKNGYTCYRNVYVAGNFSSWEMLQMQDAGAVFEYTLPMTKEELRANLGKRILFQFFVDGELECSNCYPSCRESNGAICNFLEFKQ